MPSINGPPAKILPGIGRSKNLDSADDDQIKRLNQQVTDWLNPQQFVEVADSQQLEQTMLKLSTWMGKRGSMLESEKERATWLVASGSVASLAKSIGSVATLTQEDLERIVSEWLPGASSSDVLPGELGSPVRLSCPAHLLEPVDHLIWWQPREKTIQRPPWTLPELEWLSSNEINFPDHNLLAGTAQSHAQRAILCARKSLTLFHCPRSESMDAVLAPLAVRLSAEFKDSIAYSSDDLIETELVNLNPLPRQRSAWQISCPELLTPRENESFSSLTKFIYSPWDWVLNYKARLKAGPQVDCRIVDDARRQGSLLHGFVESLLEPEPDPLEVRDNNLPDGGKDSGTDTTSGLLETLVRRLFHEEATIEWKDVSQDVVTKWVEDHWKEILTLQAAHYLVPGNEASRSELLYLAKHAIWELLQQLRAANIATVTCEEKIIDVPFCGGNVGGFIDLKVTKPDGEIGLIDMKLGGLTYRREELAKGRHLQLAIYGHLVKFKHGKDARCAYFIFSGGGRLLARTNEFFPQCRSRVSKKR